MVRRLDLDQDERIDSEDIRREFERQQLAVPPDIHIRMVQDACKIRTKAREMQLPVNA
jgi:hypothetical protein